MTRKRSRRRVIGFWAPIVTGLLVVGTVVTLTQTFLGRPSDPSVTVSSAAEGESGGASRSASSSGETEAGGGGSTFPQQSLNDPWGLSSARANCMICHSVNPNQDAFQFNRYGSDWRQELFEQIAPGSDDIFDPSQSQREEASTYAPLLRRDSDGDGYPNGVELMFGSDPGDADSHPSRSETLLRSWYTAVQRATDNGDRIGEYESRPEAIQAGPDTDGDGVPDDLERFAGFDPDDPDSTPITAARRLAAYRIVLDEAGMNVDAA